MNILIRCDASSKIGTGHVMRDLVLAKKFTSDNVTFATRSLKGNLNKHIQESDFSVHTLKSNRLGELSTLIHKKRIDLLVLDHYQLDYEFEQQLKEKHPSITLMVLDDLYKKHYCDILLNHNIYAKKKYYKNLVPKGCLLQCGPKYTLLRDEFLRPTKILKKNSLLIAMGGADTKNLTLKIFTLLPKKFLWHIDIVTTKANKNLKKLQKATQFNDSITLHIQTNKLASLAKSAKLAIISPSVIANEFYNLQIPFIAIQSAENQKLMRRFLDKEGYPTLKKFSSKKLTKILKEYID